MADLSKRDWTDEEILTILHLREVDGMKTPDIGRKYGKGRGAILGLIARVNAATDKIPCKCRKKANKDGGMKPRWWAR